MSSTITALKITPASTGSQFTDTPSVIWSSSSHLVLFEQPPSLFSVVQLSLICRGFCVASSDFFFHLLRKSRLPSIGNSTPITHFGNVHLKLEENFDLCAFEVKCFSEKFPRFNQIDCDLNLTLSGSVTTIFYFNWRDRSQ